MAKQRLTTFTDDEFLLWGLLSSNGGHRICWEMNQELSYNLIRQDDVVLTKDPNLENVYFNFYLYEDETDFFRVELIKNKSNGEFYVKELKNFDFLLMVKGELDFFEEAPFTNKLKNFSSLQAALTIDISKIKNTSQLILE